MPKFESESALNPNIKNPELNLAKTQEDIDAGEKLEGKLNVEEGQKEQKPKESELSPEEQLKNLEEKIEVCEQKITKLAESIEETKDKMNKARERLGLLSKGKEEPVSVYLEEDELKKLQARQKALEEQKKELISQQEKEWKKTIIKQEKTILEKIKNKLPDNAKKIVNVILLMTILSTTIPAFSSEAHAREQGRQPVKQEQVAQQQEQDKIIWASHSERPNWTYQESNCVQSGKYAIEKGAMDDVYRKAIAKNAKVKECYVERNQTPSGEIYYRAFALVEKSL